MEHFRDKYTVVWKQASGTEHHSPNDPLRYIRTEFKEYKELHDLLANYNLGYRDTFLRYAATKNYYRRMLLDKLANVKSEDIHTQKMVAEMKQDIATFDQEFPQHDDYDRMQELLQSHYGIFRRSPNRFFLVLPSNFDQWDADASTHTFRLYFMCNNTKHTLWTPTKDPRHVHVSSHPGYDIDRPQEFLQKHGEHALAVLLMAKFGFYGDTFQFPRLDTFQIITDHEGAVPRHSLSKDNIGALIDKAIAYIWGFRMDWSLDTREPSLWGIKSFLQLVDSDSGQGGLHMHTHEDTFWTQWICEEHFPLDLGTAALGEFVLLQGGTMNLHNNIIQVNLVSRGVASGLAMFHKKSRRCFELVVHIVWRALRTELQELVQELVESGFLILRVHGTPSNILSQSPIEFSHKRTSIAIFYGHPPAIPSYISISLQRGRRHGLLGLVLEDTIKVLDVDWETLVQDLYDELNFKFLKSDHYEHRLTLHSTCSTPGTLTSGVLQKLTAICGKHKALNLVGIDIFQPTSNHWHGQPEISGSNQWHGRLTVREGIVCGLGDSPIPNTRFDNQVLERGSLRRLVLQPNSVDDVLLYCLPLMARNPMLQRIETPDHEHNIFTRIDSIRQTYQIHPSPLELIISHHKDIILASVIFRGKDVSEMGVRSPGQHVPIVDFLEWRLDLVSGPMRDDDTWLLDSATRLFPSTLTSFTVDISALSIQGLTSVQSVLERSTLECLHVKCVPFMPFITASISQVLQAVQWPTIKSLVLSGCNVDDWLQLWMNDAGLQHLVGPWSNQSTSGPCLFSLSIIGCKQNHALLSHASALVIHHIIYSCYLNALCLKNLLLEETEDWALILGGVHFSSLRSLDLDNSNVPNLQRIGD